MYLQRLLVKIVSIKVNLLTMYSSVRMSIVGTELGSLTVEGLVPYYERQSLFFENIYPYFTTLQSATDPGGE